MKLEKTKSKKERDAENGIVANTTKRRTARIEDPFGWTAAPEITPEAEAELIERAKRDELPTGVSLLLWGWLPWDNMDVNLEVLRSSKKHMPWFAWLTDEVERQYAEKRVRKKRGKEDEQMATN